MKEFVMKSWIDRPLKTILVLALFVRIVAAIFSSGYAMHDDHFLIIESSASWAGGSDYHHWLPESQIEEGTLNPIPEGHSLFYPGVHYVLFECMEFVGLENPKIQMLFIRLIHAFISLLVVLFSFRITEKLASTKSAKIVGICIALGWAFPFYGVRNLVEMVCIPLFLMGIWHIVKVDFKDQWKVFLIAGFLFGTAFSVRFQLAVFYFFFGICLLYMQKWRGVIGLIVGFGVGAFLTQGLIDLIIWGRPFAELMEYISYNSSESMYDYGGAWQWYKYVLVLSFFSFPVYGAFWVFGATQNFKKLFWLIIPLLGFTIFHTIYPNQQERFIFPVLPIFMIVGVIGWESFMLKSKYWNKHLNLWVFFKKIAWSINIIILVAASTYATKKAKVDAAYYFYENNIDGHVNILHEDSFGDEDWYEGDATLFPTYYTGNWSLNSFYLNNKNQRENWASGIINTDYVLLHGVKNLENRIDYFKDFFPDLELVETKEASGVDKILHWLNPKNRNAQVTIIKTNYVY